MTRKSISRIRYTLGEAVKKPAHVVRDTVEHTSDLLASSGELTFGKGLIGTIIALALGALCLLGVIAFHFPEYLTTPELRRQYSVDFLRQAMLVALLIAGGLSLANIILGFFRKLNLLAFALVISAVALGGSRVPVGNFPDHTPYIGLDWFILDLLGSTLIFIAIEKLLPLQGAGTALNRPNHLDPSALATPSLAISCAAREALHQADVVETMLRGMLTVIRTGDLALAQQLRALDDTVDDC